MNIDLVLKGLTVAEAAKILASLNGSTAMATVSTPETVALTGPIANGLPPTIVGSPGIVHGNDDDESGDNDADANTPDADGIPWDARIHSTPAKRTAKNVWRKKRGVTAQEIAVVEAELKARGNAPVPQPAAPAPAPIQQQPMPPMATPQPEFTAPAPVAAMPPVNATPEVAAQPVPQPVPQPAAPAPAPIQQPAAIPADFGSFMQHVGALVQQQRVDPAYLGSLSARVGQAYNVPISSIADLSDPSRVHMVQYAAQVMQADGRW